MRVYVDTSALFALYQTQTKTYEVEACVKGGKIVISRLALLEFRSTVYRTLRSGQLKIAEARALVDGFRKDLATYVIEEMGLKSWQQAWELIEYHGKATNLRSLDALHLVAAINSHRRHSIQAFVTLDHRGLAQAARACGFKVMP